MTAVMPNMMSCRKRERMPYYVAVLFELEPVSAVHSLILLSAKLGPFSTCPVVAVSNSMLLLLSILSYYSQVTPVVCCPMMDEYCLLQRVMTCLVLLNV